MESCEKVRVSAVELQEEEKFNWESMTMLWKENIISRTMKRELCERVVILAMVYGSETWSLRRKYTYLR